LVERKKREGSKLKKKSSRRRSFVRLLYGRKKKSIRDVSGKTTRRGAYNGSRERFGPL